MKIPHDFEFGPKIITYGGSDSQELIGTGFMKKSGPVVDHYNYSPSFYSLCYVIEGEGLYEINNRSFQLSPGSIFQRFPNHTHTNKITSKDWVECFVDIGPDLFNSLCKMNILNENQVCGYIGLSQSLIDEFAMIRRKLDQFEDSSKELYASTIIQLILKMINLNRTQNKTDSFNMVSDAINHFHQNYLDRQPIEDLCSHYKWNYNLFRRVFKQETGLSPNQYRIRARIDAARSFISQHHNMGLNLIAEKFGYTNEYEFNSQFKKVVGIPPGKFIKSLHAQTKKV